MIRKQACVAFGSFEFVHRGHLKIAERVVELAIEQDLRPVILSLPKAGEVYTTEKEKEYWFEKVGIHEFITCKQQLDLEDFILYLKNELDAACIVIGNNNEKLVEIQKSAESAGIEVEAIPSVTYKDKAISYNLLVEVFEANDFEQLMELCGHPFILLGDVVHGKKLGRTVGMPTINLHIYKTKRRPNSGVYATRVNLGEETYKAITNIGKRPTVDDFDYVTIETFILDFSRQIYGEICVLEVHKFIREVQKFENLKQLQEQVQKDIEQV